MAILWRKQVDDNRYEVRSAGRTRRLYTNGVCHSEFNPRLIFTGSVWDLLILPACLYPRGSIRRVLVLGIGGGSVLRQLQHLFGPEAVIGVESDPVHLQVARRFFHADSDGSHCIQADAREWLPSYAGPPFDMIIDDLYIDDRHEPVRAVALDHDWTGQLLRHLRPEGLLTINFSSHREMLSSALLQEPRHRRRFATRFQMATPYLDNRVGAFLGRCCSVAELQDRLREIPTARRALGRGKIRYRTRQLGRGIGTPESRPDKQGG